MQSELNPRSKAIPLPERIFMVLSTIFITSLLLTNIIAAKYFTFLGLTLSCGTLVYPISFIITDIVSEIYGIQRARLLVWIGFVVSVLATGVVWISQQLPIAVNSPIDATSFGQVFGLMPGLVLGSMVAYLIAQLVDVHVFEYIRKLTNNKHLWMRNTFSTLVGQLLDTVIVVTIAWVIYPLVNGSVTAQPISWQVWRDIVVGQYLFKVMLAILDTPLVYASIYLIQRWMGLRHK